MLGECLLTELVEPSGRHVFLELAVPQLSVELEEPPPEGSELLAVQLADGLFDFLDFAHGEEPTIQKRRHGQAAAQRTWSSAAGTRLSS